MISIIAFVDFKGRESVGRMKSRVPLPFEDCAKELGLRQAVLDNQRFQTNRGAPVRDHGNHPPGSGGLSAA